MISGATYCGVPQMVFMVPPGGVFSASPKSATCTEQIGFYKQFAGICSQSIGR